MRPEKNLSSCITRKIMLEFLIILLLFKRYSTVLRKHAFNINPGIQVHAAGAFASGLAAILMALYAYYAKPGSFETLTSPENRQGMKLMVIGILISFCARVHFSPLFKRFDLSKYRMMITPLSTAITILYAVFFLKETLTPNLIGAVVLFGAASVLAQKS